MKKKVYNSLRFKEAIHLKKDQGLLEKDSSIHLEIKL